MLQPENDEAGHGREGALAALNEVAADPDVVRQFGASAGAFEPDDYQHLIALAWRHQFDDDRTKFKRDLRALQEHVSQRILDRAELSE
ncbi:hypothetical protein [Micromonospora sp. WMMD714]|uniref:hypothetical protein n=1 Tax=Micromonospora sp. WMMD714 TaxID=3016097 RepID=UPI00249C376C|nr:hypothetical protein [Micromonospora sp. WMMD714]WFE62419.1 hypothetical protein O7625_03550 [Micromonospora sp. WMMD714]